MKHASLFAIALSLPLLISGCTPVTCERTGFALNTTCTITLYGTTGNALLDGCFNRIRHAEGLFSRTVEGSDVWRINHANGQPTTVDAATAALLREALDKSVLSDGAFDVTIAPVSTLWDFGAATPELPEAATLKAAAARVDYRQLKLNGNTVKLPADGAVDLGGIAKGYMADALRAYLREQGVTSALINLGGNVIAMGSKNGQPWTVGVRDPRDESKTAAVLEVTDRSVVTSGSYERGFTLNGIRYHHILDPSTGWPVENGLASVTIVSARSVDGDALSTACFVLGLEKGRALVEGLDGVEALFISDDGTLTATAGMRYTVP